MFLNGTHVGKQCSTFDPTERPLCSEEEITHCFHVMSLKPGCADVNLAHFKAIKHIREEHKVYKKFPFLFLESRITKFHTPRSYTDFFIIISVDIPVSDIGFNHDVSLHGN